jgi:hypothetical protein
MERQVKNSAGTPPAGRRQVSPEGQGSPVLRPLLKSCPCTRDVHGRRHANQLTYAFVGEA